MVTGRLRTGRHVKVPWGLSESVDGVIVDVIGDPPAHVRVRLLFSDPDDAVDAPVVLLQSSVLEDA